MRKKWIVYGIVLVLFSSFALLLIHMNNENTRVIVSIQDGTLSKTGFRYTMQNHTQDYVFTYGNDFAVERWDLLSGWSEYHGPKKKSVFAINHVLEPGNSREYGINWESVYGELESGIYRFVKTVKRSDGSTYQIRLYFII